LAGADGRHGVRWQACATEGCTDSLLVLTTHHEGGFHYGEGNERPEEEGSEDDAALVTRTVPQRRGRVAHRLICAPGRSRLEVLREKGGGETGAPPRRVRRREVSAGARHAA